MHLAGACVLEQVGGLGETGFVDVGDRDQGAAAGALEREGPADAGAGAGDDDDLVVQRLHAVTLSPVAVERAVATS